VPRLNPALVVLRGAAMAALALLLWNPSISRSAPGGGQPLVLLDASLSMAVRWRVALDSARALARSGRGGAGSGVIWRFGDRVAAFDTSPPADGASRLAPALDAAAAREGEGGAVTVVTDGAIGDARDLPADLLAQARVIVLPGPRGFDAFVARVTGPRRLTVSDTLTLQVIVGTAGTRAAGQGKGTATLAVSVGARRLASQPVSLPDSGTITTRIILPPSHLPPPGFSALEVRLEGVAADSEPRDDARLLVIEVSPQPAAVVLASPPDWESRFLGRVLGEVTRVPVRTYVETEPGRWRDAATLDPVATAQVTRAAAGARLLALVGAPNRFAAVRAGGGAGVLTWIGGQGRPGDWYVGAPPASPLAGELAGIAWDSLPPLAAVADTAGAAAGGTAILTAQLARRGPPTPIVLAGASSGGGRRVTVVAAGLWRWAFRGGASEQAYRGVVAALADYLLGGVGASTTDRVAPIDAEVANGLPLAWRWSGTGRPDDVILTLNDGQRDRADTLRFDAAGRAELRLPPGVYRYAARGGPERGLVAVEAYSDEWRPASPTVSEHVGRTGARRESIGLRDRWWLFLVAIAAFAGEWAWRRRQGLP
jgi:hypothetical protein